MKAYFFIISFLLLTQITAQGIIPDTLRLKISTTQGVDKANAYNRAGSYCILSSPDLAISFAQKALAIGFVLQDLNSQAIAMGIMGEAYFYKSAYDSSVVLYLRAIKICEKTGNRRKLANYLNGLGTVFYQMGDFKKSVFYMKQAADIKLADGLLIEYGIILTNLAGVSQRLGRFDESIQLLREAERILIGTKYTGIFANIYNTMGSAFQLGYNNLDSAEYYYLKNISVLNQPGLESFGLSAFTNLGELYLTKGNFDQSEFYLLKALAFSLSYQRRAERVAIYDRLATLYQKKGLFEKAYHFQKQELLLKDSIFNEDNQVLVQQLETQYQIEKKDAQIKEQQLGVQKRINRENTIIFIGVVIALMLLSVALFFIIRARSKGELEKAKSRMFQNIVHEIRTPLTLIAGPLQLLKKESTNEKSLAQLELIEKNSDRLVALVNELLVASKLEKKEYVLTNQVGDIVAFSKNLVHSFSTEAAENNIQLEFESNLNEKKIRFAAAAFEKILTNLISNSIKYNKQGGKVNVILHIEENVSRLIVKDTGIGMNKKQLERIFERFYRVNDDHLQAGFGIGLSVVKELVDLLKGNIQVDSEEGRGTAITVTIPHSNDKLDISEKNVEGNGVSTILVVEDDDDIYEFIQQVLGGYNWKTIRGHNGQDGFNRAEEVLPDLIITDVMMPLEDGISMTGRLKQNPLTQHIPVMMLSAKQSLESRLDGIGVGADFYLAKPFNPEELSLLVKNTLQTAKYNQERYAINIQESFKTYNERVAGNDTYLKKVVEIVDEHILETDFSVNELAEALHISRSQLHRKITSITGFSTTHFIRIIRLEKAKDLLESNAGNITEIAYECGFNSQSYFTRSFTEYFKITPTDFLKKS